MREQFISNARNRYFVWDRLMFDPRVALANADAPVCGPWITRKTRNQLIDRGLDVFSTLSVRLGRALVLRYSPAGNEGVRHHDGS
jgi:hypothetical protein